MNNRTRKSLGWDMVIWILFIPTAVMPTLIYFKPSLLNIAIEVVLVALIVVSCYYSRKYSPENQ